jgi:hypothetical protein
VFDEKYIGYCDDGNRRSLPVSTQGIEHTFVSSQVSPVHDVCMDVHDLLLTLVVVIGQCFYIAMVLTWMFVTIGQCMNVFDAL